MIKIAITGNIASGKSFVCKALSRHLASPVFNADEQVAQILTNPIVLQKLSRALGVEFLNLNLASVKNIIRTQIFNDRQKKAILESIIYHHLRLARKIWSCKNAKNNQYLIYEVPLLFEKRLASQYNIAIAVDGSSFFKQAIAKRCLDAEVATKFAKSQMPIVLKNKMADCVFKNNLNPFVFKKSLLKLADKIMLNSI